MLITLGPRLKGVKAVSKMNRRWEGGGGFGVGRVFYIPYDVLSLLSASLLSSGPDTIFKSPDLLITAVI